MMQLMVNPMAICAVIIAAANLILTICRWNKGWRVLMLSGLFCGTLAVLREYRSIYKLAAVELWEDLWKRISVINHQLSWFLLVVFLLNVVVLVINLIREKQERSG